MSLLRRGDRIPDDVWNAAKAAGFKKPDIYSGPIERKRSSLGEPALPTVTIVLLAVGLLLAGVIVVLDYWP